MSIAVLDKKSKEANSFVGLFDFQGSNLKKVSALKQFIGLFTDKKNVKESAKLVKAFEDLKEDLVNGKNQLKTLNKALLEAHINTINLNIATTNKFFSDIEMFADNKVIIDDANMLGLINNIKKLKELLEYIHNYLEIASSVYNSKKELSKNNSKKYTSSELIELLKTA